MSTSLNPCVALLRHQLFQPSEVFITEQARALRKFAPLLVGRVLAGKPCGDVSYHVPAVGRMEQLRYLVRRDPRMFAPALAERRPVLVHAHFGVEAVYGIKLADAMRVPLVTTFHGFDATMRRARLLTARKASWVQYVLKRAELRGRGTLFIAVSEFIRSRVLELGFPAERTRVHYIGVDTASFEPRVENDDNPPTVLHVARLVEKKGTRYLLDAFAAIAAKHPRARVVVIGDGPLRGALEQHAATLGIGARVHWLGAVPHADVRARLSRASVFCLPSCTAADGDAEGLGLVLLEAAASGVPVVGTLHGGIPEAVIHGATGYLVPERDPSRLADALDALLSSSDLRRRLGAEARRFAQRRFDLHRQTRSLEELYEDVL